MSFDFIWWVALVAFIIMAIFFNRHKREKKGQEEQNRPVLQGEEKIAKAVNENSFFELLTGQGEYEFVNRFADTPTDPITVLFYVEKYYTSTKDDDVWRMFGEAMLTLCASEIYIWLVPYYIADYLTYVKRSHHDPFPINDVNLPFNQGLDRFRESLERNTDWMGRNEPDGLYGDIIRMSNILRENYHFDLVYC